MLLLLRQPEPRVRRLSKAEDGLCGARWSGWLRHWLQWRYLTIAVGLCLSSVPVRAEDCIDVSRDAPIQLSGQLIHKTFPGPSDDEGIARFESCPVAKGVAAQGRDISLQNRLVPASMIASQGLAGKAVAVN